jgi:hypothetical protein
MPRSGLDQVESRRETTIGEVSTAKHRIKRFLDGYPPSNGRYCVILPPGSLK